MSPTFTVLTPTYNRAHTLPRLHESLHRQTCADFEWLLVDDGSTDGTADIVRALQASDATMPIHYVRQPNTGKAAAFNRGVRLARGTLIAQIDSDDELLPTALQAVLDAWGRINSIEREHFVGVTGLCVNDNGAVVGSSYPSDAFVSDSLESRYRYKIRGEKWGFQRRDVLSAFPFPEDLLTKHVPEGLVWSRIAREYKTLYVNVPLRVYHAGTDQITCRSAAVSAQSMAIQHAAILDHELDWFRWAPVEFYRSAVHYGRAEFHLGHNLRTQWQALHHALARALWALALPPAWLVYRRDLFRARRAK